MIAAMNAPRPTDDLDAFTDAYSAAWTTDPIGLLEFFDSGGSYTDMAMGTTYEGHGGIAFPPVDAEVGAGLRHRLLRR